MSELSRIVSVALLSTALATASVVCSSCKRGKHRSESEPSGEPLSTESIDRPAPPVARTWVVPEVRLELVASRGQEQAIDSTALARRLGSGVRASVFFVDDERQTPKGRQFAPAMVVARVSYDVLDQDSSQPRGFVALELVVLPDPAGAAADELASKENVIVEKPLAAKISGDALALELTEQAELAIDLGIKGLLEKEAMRTFAVSELTEVLARADDLSFWALELIADRKAHEALDAVVRALRGDDAELSDASISVLVALGEPAAVSALTENVDFQNYERLRVIIEASAALGGEDAAEFLEFVASGHPDESIKARAVEALAEVKTQSASKTKLIPSLK